MDFCVEIKKIWQKVLRLLVRGFFWSFLKSIAWYGFCYGFLVVLNLFHNILFKAITKYYKHCFIKKTFGSSVL
jgi:hypothetical protein